MRKISVLLVVLAAVAGNQSAAWAQRQQGRGMGGGMGDNRLGLLSQQSVQDELKLTGEQVKRAAEQAEKQREWMGGLRDLSPEERQKEVAEHAKSIDATLASILNANQLKRIQQISLQQRGGRSFSDPQIAQSLGLTAEQKEKIAAIEETARGETRGLFQGGGGGGDPEARQKMLAARKATDEKLQGVLTPEQQSKWKELVGPPFKGEIVRPQGRGGNRQARAA